MNKIMKDISPARHEQSDVLQQDGGFDEDYDGIVYYSFDHRELSKHLRQYSNDSQISLELVSKPT